ncbi:MAG: copper chaperone PCu(A)C [Burkholderiales bacterium]
MNIVKHVVKPAVVAALLALAVTAASAHEYQLGPIKIDHPYARSTAAGQPTGGGYMSFVNAGVGDRLVSASADVAKSVELHEMKMEGDVMKMRQVEGIEIGGGKTVELKPGGYHLMFVGLKAPLKEGASFPMKLKFEKAGEVTVEVKIEAPGTAHGAKH